MKLVLATLCLAALSLGALAQKIGDSGTTTTVRVKHAAVLPIAFFRNGDLYDHKEPIDAFKDDLNAVLTKYAIDTVDEPHVRAAWQQATGMPFDDKQDQLPDPKDLLKVGHELGVDYVIFARCKYHVNSVWQGLGPKTHADARVDLWIVDVANSEFALKAEDVKGGDTEHEPGWKTAVTLLVAPISPISGGPETGHMKVAGVVALDKALAPWVEKQESGTTKIK